MGFISFSLNYYNDELNRLEASTVSEQTIYRAKRLLKMLDDLLDEGYAELAERLEAAFRGVSRLKAYLKANHAEPFPIFRKPFSQTEIVYDAQPRELTEAIEYLTATADNCAYTSDNDFLPKLIRFCEWVGYEDDTAYVFLLRDTLVPYIYYKSQGKKRIYPWLLSRKALSALTGKYNVDDEIRASVIKALEHGNCRSYGNFCGTVLPDIRNTLKRYPEIECNLNNLLAEIKEKRIIIVESGCSGTFPMLLMSLDDRVDFRMYTTYPYLFDIYGDKIYTHKYEENRLFETLYCQDLYFDFYGLQDGRFYVNKCETADVVNNSLAEIKAIINCK